MSRMDDVGAGLRFLYVGLFGDSIPKSFAITVPPIDALRTIKYVNTCLNFRCCAGKTTKAWRCFTFCARNKRRVDYMREAWWQRLPCSPLPKGIPGVPLWWLAATSLKSETYLERSCRRDRKASPSPLPLAALSPAAETIRPGGQRVRSSMSIAGQIL